MLQVTVRKFGYINLIIMSANQEKQYNEIKRGQIVFSFYYSESTGHFLVINCLKYLNILI